MFCLFKATSFTEIAREQNACRPFLAVFSLLSLLSVVERISMNASLGLARNHYLFVSFIEILFTMTRIIVFDVSTNDLGVGKSYSKLSEIIILKA